jgi:glycosyltransferase involved in cell wall biosynthesis
MSMHNDNVKVLANDVVDFEFFNKRLTSPTPGEIAPLKRPIVGFVGGLSSFKQDYELLETVADEHAQWSFVFIGPCRVDVSGFGELPKRDNMLFLGSRLHEEIPAYIAAFDVCIIPNRLNLYNRHSFPMKFFEYLSMGKPVVATDMPALKPYCDYVYIARSAEEFVESLRTALEENSSEKEEKRIRFAAAHDWEQRGRKILHLLESALKEMA